MFDAVRVEHFGRLLWLWPIVILAVATFVGIGWRHRQLRKFADDRMMQHVMPGWRPWRAWLKCGFVSVALLFLGVAIIDPRWGFEERTVRRRGIDVVVLLDLSQSMLAEDARPNRLVRARQYIHDMVNAMDGDRVALVTFAGRPSLSCPLTVDHSSFRLALDLVSPDEVELGGSRLGDALQFCQEVFTDENPEFKSIVVFTDGEDHESEPLAAAQELYELYGTPIYTVGIGDDVDGARVPSRAGERDPFLRFEGEEVVSRMDGSLLRSIADQTGGIYIPVGTGAVDMGAVYSQRIEPTEKAESESRDVRHYMPRYQYFACAALFLLVLESLVGQYAPIRRRTS